MLFSYEALSQSGQMQKGKIEAISLDVAISSLQRRKLTVSNIVPAGKGSFLETNISFLERVKTKEVVLLSQQLSTLFAAQVSALRIFRLLSAEHSNLFLKKVLSEIANDIQNGSSISRALSKHPKIFSNFYVNMIKAGEESGTLDQTFTFLGEHLERNYETVAKIKSALIYPAFVILVFVGVMTLMFTVVIPQLSVILVESGQEIPFYTQMVINISNFFVVYGIFLLVASLIGFFVFWKWSKTDAGALSVARFKISFPYVGTLFSRLYLSRIADNMNTMLSSAIPMIKALEITSGVVGNLVFENILDDTIKKMRGGGALSDALAGHKEIPGIMVQMVKVGEESGEVGNILNTMAGFYRREVKNAVDTLVGFIEPALIIGLGFGVGFLLMAILIPIYNVAGAV